MLENNYPKLNSKLINVSNEQIKSRAVTGREIFEKLDSNDENKRFIIMNKVILQYYYPHIFQAIQNNLLKTYWTKIDFGDKTESTHKGRWHNINLKVNKNASNLKQLSNELDGLTSIPHIPNVVVGNDLHYKDQAGDRYLYLAFPVESYLRIWLQTPLAQLLTVSELTTSELLNLQLYIQSNAQDIKALKDALPANLTMVIDRQIKTLNEKVEQFMQQKIQKLLNPMQVYFNKAQGRISEKKLHNHYFFGLGLGTSIISKQNAVDNLNIMIIAISEGSPFEYNLTSGQEKILLQKGSTTREMLDDMAKELGLKDGKAVLGYVKHMSDCHTFNNNNQQKDVILELANMGHQVNIDCSNH